MEGMRTSSDDSTATRIAVTGDLDMFAAGELRERLLRLDRESDGDIEIDLAAVSFIDSGGIGVLVGALRRAEAQGRRLTVVNVGAAVRQVFEVTHLARAFGLDPE